MNNRMSSLGFTLIELLIASSIGMIVLLSLMSLLLSQQNAVRSTVESIRFAQYSQSIYELFDNTLSHSGYQGCNRLRYTSLALQTQTGITTFSTDGKAQQNQPDAPDTLSFFHTRSDAQDVTKLTDTHVTLATPHGLSSGSTALLISCSAVQQVTVEPDKQPNDLRFKAPINAALFASQRVSLVPMIHSRLYIKNDRLMIKHGTSPAFEISSDIENIQLRYLNLAQNDITYADISELSDEERELIHSVQFSALMSFEQTAQTTDQQHYDFAGKTYPANMNDPTNRQEVTSIVMLRNRL